MSSAVAMVATLIGAGSGNDVVFGENGHMPFGEDSGTISCGVVKAMILYMAAAATTPCTVITAMTLFMV